MSEPRVWSPQQQAVFDWVKQGKGNAIIKAVAGSGKTTTLVEAMNLMTGSVAFAAYNKKIASEIESKVRGGPQKRVGTFHSYGFSAWRRAAPDVKVDDKKLFNIFDELEVPVTIQKFVQALVSIAKQQAFGVLTAVADPAPWWDAIEHFDLRQHLTDEYSQDEGAAIEWAKRVLNRSIETDHVSIDFDDMIYSPLVHKVKVWQHDWVLVDEAQDTNPARRALLRRMLSNRGRMVAVGDPAQAIYGFTGADANSMQLISDEFNCVSLPLTVSYRCPQSVVREAQQYVSHIQSHPTAPEGRVRTFNEEQFWTEAKAGKIGADQAILCRNTKPLVELAYALIRQRIACHVEGREIGKGLLALATRWKRIRSVSALLTKLEEYQEREMARLIAKGQELKAEAVADKVDTLRAIIGSIKTQDADVEDVKDAINQLFDDQDPPRSLTLSTVHKSKGREWPRVLVWGANQYMPSGYARQQWQLDQENNLIYVAITRAKYELVWVGLAPQAQER